MSKVSRYAPLLLLAALTTANAQTIDIRDCPLNTLVFADQWTGATFTVDRVATNYFQICADGEEPPHESCAGPYGNLMLEGTHLRDAEAEPRTATASWTVIKAVPCCGWSVEWKAIDETGENFTWREGAEVPRLGDMDWLSIESDYGSTFGNPFQAVACTLR